MVGIKGMAQEICTSKCTDCGKTLGIGSEIMFSSSKSKIILLTAVTVPLSHAKCCIKLKPTRRSTLQNAIDAMFQFQGGISEVEQERIIVELQQLQYIGINENNKVTYLQKSP